MALAGERLDATQLRVQRLAYMLGHRKPNTFMPSSSFAACRRSVIASCLDGVGNMLTILLWMVTAFFLAKMILLWQMQRAVIGQGKAPSITHMRALERQLRKADKSVGVTLLVLYRLVWLLALFVLLMGAVLVSA